MEVEVMIPSPPPDSASTTPYISAPSSPQRAANFFYSAPISPTRISALYHGGYSLSPSTAVVPFNWEEKPGVPKSPSAPPLPPITATLKMSTDFAFDFSGQLERASLPADELFDGGKIKPLKPPPRPQYDPPARSPRSPKSMIKEVFAPKNWAKSRITTRLEQNLKKPGRRMLHIRVELDKI